MNMNGMKLLQLTQPDISKITTNELKKLEAYTYTLEQYAINNQLVEVGILFKIVEKMINDFNSR